LEQRRLKRSRKKREARGRKAALKRAQTQHIVGQHHAAVALEELSDSFGSVREYTEQPVDDNPSSISVNRAAEPLTQSFSDLILRLQ
jgi:hypothetical protein